MGNKGEADLLKIAILAQQGLGDLIMAFPLFKGLQEQVNDDIEFYVIVNNNIARNFLDERFPGNKFNFIELNGKGFARRKNFFDVALYLRRLHLDVLLTYGFFAPSKMKLLWLLLVNARKTVTTVNVPKLFGLDVNFVDVNKKVVHKSEMANMFLCAAGFREQDLNPVYEIKSKALTKAKEIIRARFSADSPMMAIVPSCNKNNPEKIWAKDNYVDLLKKIKSFNQNYKFIFFSANEDEEDFMKQITNEFDESSCLNIVASTYEESRAFFSLCRIVFGIDSGGLHIASTVGGPQIFGLFGPYNPELTGPIYNPCYHSVTSDVDCAPCGDYRNFVGPGTYTCRDYKCMKMISVEKVYKCMEQYL